MQNIDYFMSPSSPWTYLGSKLFTQFVSESKRQVNVYPVNFGQIFSVSGGLPLPKRAPQRQSYRLLELKRWKQRRNSSMKIEPSNFPSTKNISSLAIIAVRELDLDALAFSNSILAALWEDDKNIDDPEVIKGVCKTEGLNPEEIMDNALSRAIEIIFEQNTKHAIQNGIFGAPTYLIDGELFWGQDRLDFVAEKLGLTLK